MKDNPAALWAAILKAQVVAWERKWRRACGPVGVKRPDREFIDLSNLNTEASAATERFKQSVRGWVGRMKPENTSPYDWKGWKVQPDFKFDLRKVTVAIDAAGVEVRGALKVWADTMHEHAARVKLLPPPTSSGDSIQVFNTTAIQAAALEWKTAVKTWARGVRTHVQTWKPGKLHINLDIITPTGEALWELMTDAWAKLPPNVRHLLPYVATASFVGLATHMMHINYLSPTSRPKNTITTAGQVLDLPGHSASQPSPLSMDTNFLLPGPEAPGIDPSLGPALSTPSLAPMQPSRVVPVMLATAAGAKELAEQVAALTRQLEQGPNGLPRMGEVPAGEEALQVALLASLLASQAAMSAAHLAAYSVACASAAQERRLLQQQQQQQMPKPHLAELPASHPLPLVPEQQQQQPAPHLMELPASHPEPLSFIAEQQDQK